MLRRIFTLATVTAATAVVTFATMSGASTIPFRPAPAVSGAGTVQPPQQVSSAPQRALEPKEKLVEAIRQFAEALTGRYGDEKALVWSAIDGMHSGLVEWDEALGAYEAALARRNVEQQVMI